MNAPTLYSKFDGWWCDECRIAAQWHNCPSCGLRMRPAVVEVTPTDIDLGPQNIGSAIASEPGTTVTWSE